MATTTNAMEPDELYTLRAQYWLGHYTLAIQEAKSIARRPMSTTLKIEREEFLARSYLALKQYDKIKALVVTSSTDALSSSPGKFIMIFICITHRISYDCVCMLMFFWKEIFRQNSNDFNRKLDKC